MSKYIIEYYPDTGMFYDKNGMFMCTYLGATLDLAESETEAKGTTVDSVKALVASGLSVDDIIKLRNAGLA